MIIDPNNVIKHRPGRREVKLESIRQGSFVCIGARKINRVRLHVCETASIQALILIKPVNYNYAHHNECQIFINAALAERINITVILA